MLGMIAKKSDRFMTLLQLNDNVNTARIAPFL